MVARGKSLVIVSMTSTDVTIEISDGRADARNGEITINNSVTVTITPIDTNSAILTFS